MKLKGDIKVLWFEKRKYLLSIATKRYSLPYTAWTLGPSQCLLEMQITRQNEHAAIALIIRTCPPFQRHDRCLSTFYWQPSSSKKKHRVYWKKSDRCLFLLKLFSLVIKPRERVEGIIPAAGCRHLRVRFILRVQISVGIGNTPMNIVDYT